MVFCFSSLASVDFSYMYFDLMFLDSHVVATVTSTNADMCAVSDRGRVLLRVAIDFCTTCWAYIMVETLIYAME